MRGWRRTADVGAGCGGAIALALAVLVGSVPAGHAQTVGEGEIVTCTFSDAQIEGLKEAIADALDLPNTNNVTTPIVIVPSFEDNLGQPNDQGGNPDLTGIVICSNEDEVASFDSVSESEDFPSSGTADLLELQQTSYVLIEVGNTRSLRICHTDQINDCFVATEP